MKKRSILTICEQFEENCNGGVGPKGFFGVLPLRCDLTKWILVSDTAGREFPR